MATKSNLRTLPIIERWDCHQCTACCRETTIQLDQDDLAKLTQQKWEEQPEFHGVRTTRRSWLLGGARVLNHKADGSCVFLTGEGRCRIHEKFGAEAKPFMCRLFPLQVVTTDRSSLATTVRSCPSAAADRGRPLSEHLQFLKQLVPHGDVAPVAPPVVGRAGRGWVDFHAVADGVQLMLTDERLPLVRRVVHCIRFTNLLEGCKLTRVPSESLAELIEAMEELAGADAGHLFQDRQPPARRTARLFRRLGAHFIRCFPGGTPVRTLGEQWRVMRLSGRLAAASNTLPELHPRFPALATDQLESPIGPLNADILQPLSRFFESHAASKRYALTPPGGALVDSVRRLTFAFPMSLWMLRWLAAGREPTVNDMVQIVVAVERGIALPALNSASRYLADSGQLERLAAWYSR